ncbi:zinc finger CCCH domain-containing protein 7A [Spea bombifrons]|uniref:zinc finger CCCH domain-containing protein 7A n=1 Tax=Spea bombifrons TaxID=233779 RepID=UPI00234A7A1B|nr:zinc finger CCCH domain-containing protein 7A [Spea bombifrons]
MSYVVSDRLTRQEDIKKGLQFIQSSLPFFGTDNEYEVFLQRLIRNLYNEGNDLFRESRANDSINQYSEALSVAEYASSEDISIPDDVLEKVYANRAASYSKMGLHENALKDCESAINLNEDNLRVLYRKSKALYMLERYKEAYDSVARCSLTAPQDESVVKLTQDLAKKLKLKIRKAYVRCQPDQEKPSVDGTEKVSESLAEQIEPDLPEISSESPLSSFQTLSVATNSVNDLDSVPVSSPSPDVISMAEAMTFPSALVSNGCSASFPTSYLRDGEVIGEELDHILDSVPDSNLNMSITTLPESLSTTLGSFPTNLVESIRLHNYSFSDMYSQPLTAAFNSFPLKSSVDSHGVSLGHQNGASNAAFMNSSKFPVHNSAYFLQPNSPSPFSESPIKGLEGFSNSALSVSYSTPVKGENPLEGTHEFRQACQLCLSIAGSKCHSFSINFILDHRCKKDILIGRMKNSADGLWKKIRPRPIKNQYLGPFYICKDVAQGVECKYPGHCTFAYSQEEIDVWTLERKGIFCRDALFGGDGKDSLTIPHLLQEYSGRFVFLCEKCFDHKPRIISKESKDSSLYCSHPLLRHDFEDNKCLVHIFTESTVKYYKIRPFSPGFELDLCRHEVRYGCLREDDCSFAHSLVELRVWVMQKETGMSLDTLVQESTNFSGVESGALGSQIPNIPNNHRFPNFKIKFVCGQCWRNGQVIEADKNRKYCSAKARHQWTKDRQVVLVMSNERKKWISIRPFPTKKPVPLQFEMCNHIVTGKKCQYIGNCSFAHSPEEREIWTYMKDCGIQDIEHLCDKLLKSKKSEKGDGVSVQANKQIHLPTDYAETTVDFHCWLCGKNCNSERQWKMHISSDKHKEKVFHSEDDPNIWQHRFPTGSFSLCERFLSSRCPDGEKCKFAHGHSELLEWNERRKVLCQKLIKARNDQLISPDDNDFGKYSFLIKDLN